MSLMKCPKCGEMFSESYKECPFCAEDEEYYNGKVKKRGRRQTEKKAKTPSIVGPALVLVLVLLVLALVWTFFGDSIRNAFSGINDVPPTQQTDPSTDTDTPVAGLTLNKTALQLAVGESETLSVTGGDTYTWSNSDPTVVSVTENGEVTAVANGMATLTVTSGELSAACAVTVSDQIDEPDATDTDKPDATETDTPDDTETNVDVSKLSISVPLYGTQLSKISEGHFDVSLGKGESFDLQINGTDVKPTWSSKNTSVATIDSGGTLKGVSSGETTVEAKLGSTTIDILVRVK